MSRKSSEVDEYIANAPDYAKPILKRIRMAFHKGCSQLEESMKWGFPHFDYKGIVGSMAAFKEYARYGFWKSKLMIDPHGILKDDSGSSMFQSHIRSLDDLPDMEILVSYVRQAVQLNEAGVKLDRPARKPKPAFEVPEDLNKLLAKNAKARKAFNAFPPSHRREYVEWIDGAKRPETRQRRLESTIDLLNDEKSLNWKYQPKK